MFIDLTFLKGEVCQLERSRACRYSKAC